MSQYKIGKYLYLFTPDSGIATECVISAHGGWDPQMGTFKVPPGLELRFYADEGEASDDFGLANWASMSKRVLTNTYFEGDDVKNYSLTKYQGKHNKDVPGNPRETYGSIGKVVNDLSARHEMEAQYFAKYGRIPGGHTAIIDVLTVRNRINEDDRKTLLGTSLLLEDVINTVTQSSHYAVFHCFFCRNRINRVAAWGNRKYVQRRI